MPSTNHPKSRGEDAESLACRFLEGRGLKLLTRNYRSRGGEIDLVMLDRDSLVFVEVRYRRQTRFGHAAETVSWRKQQRIIHCAGCYLSRHRCWNRPARFDVVSLEGDPARPRIEWLRNAFGSKG
ncbi:MAG TPA: YraN family protein [Gammaproteobacteria bacterium]|nr:YraN family protein [Gammaproteobacteria bacterium]